MRASRGRGLRTGRMTVNADDAGVVLDFRNPGLPDPEQLTECGLRQAACLPKRPQVLTKLARKVDREVHAADVLRPIYML